MLLYHLKATRIISAAGNGDYGSGLFLLASLLVVPATPSAGSPTTLTAAKTVLDQAIEAQGGAAALDAIKSVTLTTQGYRNMLEQSERPEGPYILEYDTIVEIRNQAAGRYRISIDSTVPPSYRYSQGIVADRTVAMRVGGPKPVRGDSDMVASAREALALSPERLLLTARAAEDLQLANSETLQAVPQDVITFTFDGAPVRVFLNRYTHLPTALDYSGPLARAGHWARLGDVTMRTYYSYWARGNGGVRFPMQWDIYRNGLHESTLSVRSIAINALIAEPEMAIPSDVRANFATALARSPATVLGRPGQPAVEAAPGIIVIPGAWNVTIVRQDDGIVIVEAPISSDYSEQVIAEAARRFPGVPVKAVVTTSDSWPHIGGLRAYVARGIPVYGLALNKPIIDRLVTASFTAKPDALQRQRRRMRYIPVDRKTTIGSGTNLLEIFPIRGETSERQALVYWPTLQLLYGSDPFQDLASNPQTVGELADAVRRENLNPERLYMMHMMPIAWRELVAATSQPTLFPDGSALR
ncbi:MAG: hypothetical protein ABIQ43_07240 [Sphingomonas sp.]